MAEAFCFSVAMFRPLIPLSNTIPAVSVVFLTAGMVERDGLLVAAGYVVNIGAWIYFALLSTGLITVVHKATEYFGH